MAYTKTTWVNDETEVNAQNMNHIEDGIFNSQNVQLIAISDTAPSECSEGDKYYNTEDDLIYTATAIDTWSSTGEAPLSDILYIILDEKTTYTYNGETLISVGGGSSDIIIVGDESEATEDTKLLVEPDDLSPAGTEIVNQHSESTVLGYSANYINNLNTYSTSEVNTGKKWYNGKPIYRRTIVVDNITTYGDYVSTGVSISNVDDVVELKSTAKRVPSSSSYAWYMTGTLTETSHNNNYITAARFTNGVVQYLANNSSYGIKKIIIIIEYTKTTD